MRRLQAMVGSLGWAAVLVLGVAGAARAAFEDVEVSPRARALGGSWAALSADPYAAFHNPAMLAWTDRTGGMASYVRPFGYDFSSQSVVAGAVALPHGLGGVGLGVRRFGVDYLGENLTTETTVAVAHGFHLLADRQSELTVGWAFDVYGLEFGRSVTGLDPGRASSFGLGVGAAAVIRDRTRVGFSALNLNNPSIGDRDREELRRRVSVGVSYAPYPGVETVLDIASELGEEVQYRGGAEFQVGDFASLRAGIRSEPSTFGAGIGFRLRGLRLDYGFSTGGGVLGETHQFGIGYLLPGPQ